MFPILYPFVKIVKYEFDEFCDEDLFYKLIVFEVIAFLSYPIIVILSIIIFIYSIKLKFKLDISKKAMNTQIN